jgi:hypothetical protein
MDLQDFVTTTLCQISAGVATAKNYDRCIAPRIREDDSAILHTRADAEGVFLVEFDVAVDVLETTENGAPGKIVVLLVASTKGKAKRSIENSLLNRMKFNVPITYK